MSDAVYRERAHLVAHLAALYPSHIGFTDSACPDWAVVFVSLPTGQVTWHVSPDDLDLFEHVTRNAAETWDGHDTVTKYRRLDHATRIKAAGHWTE